MSHYISTNLNSSSQNVSNNPFENYDVSNIFTGTRPPIGFYRKSKNRIKVIRYFVENILHKKGIECLFPVSIEEFKKHHIYGLLTTYYNCAPRKAIEEAYSEELKSFNLYSDPEVIIPNFFSGHLSEPPRSFWKEQENRIKTTTFFVEKVLGKTVENLYEITAKDFQKNGLNGFLTHYYNSSPIRALKEAYPQTKSFLFNRIEKSDWESLELRQETCKFFIESILGITQEDEILTLSMKKLTTAGLKHTLARYYKGDIKTLLGEAYPQLDLSKMKIKGKRNKEI